MGRVKASVQFPFINLEKAIARAQQLYSADQRGNEMSVSTAFAVWGYSDKSSGGFQTISALKNYGLLEEGSAGKVKLTKHALDYFRDEREDHRAQRLQDFATNPTLLMELFNQWGSHVPSDTVARSHLKIDRGLSEQSARSALGIFKENIAFANVKGDGKVAEIKDGKGSLKKPPVPKVGDFVQWTSNGIDQFKPARKVTKIEGDHVWVFGSNTGIPMKEVTLANAPTPTMPSAFVEQAKTLAASAQNPQNEAVEDTPQIDVLLRGNRLQITADVDAAGLVKLKDVLAKYEEILKLLQ
jgi:hypothetical protein